MPTLLSANTVACRSNSVGRLMADISNAVNGQQEWKAIMCAGRPSPLHDDLTKPLHGIWRYRQNALSARIGGRDGWTCNNGLSEKITQLQPDILHLHNFHGYWADLDHVQEALTHRSPRTHVVFTWHDCWWLTGRCAYFTANNCQKFRTGCHNCRYPKAYPATWHSGAEARNLTAKKAFLESFGERLTVVVPSQWMAQRVSESTLSDIISPEVIPNWVDSRIFYPSKSETRSGILAVASKWTPEKGWLEICRLATAFPDCLTIAGKVPNLLPGANCVGPIADENQLADLYRCHRVFVNPSRQESFGLTTMEALSCGTPVVISADNPLAPQITSDWGRVIRKGEDWTEVVKQVLGLDDNRQSPPSWVQQASPKAYLDLYSRVLRG